MLFDLNLSIISLRDVLSYADVVILLTGIMLMLLHFVFLTSRVKYPILMEYSSRASVYLLILVQTFNIYTYTFFNDTINYKLFHGSLILNKEILLLKIVIIFLAILILLVSETFFKDTKMGYFEYNILFLASVLGCLITLSANDLMTFYISLEIQALAFYIMATMKKSAISSEAGLKYFIVGSFSSAILLFGISLIILLTGHQNFDNINLFLQFQSSLQIQNFGVLIGSFFIITALLIKLAVAPFHEWVADVYEGIMTPTALFFATIPKISNFFILVRLVQNVFVSLSDALQPFLILICLLSLIFGSLNAYKQQNIKRFLAFSSVNHFGFILIGLAIGTKAGIAASFFYLAFYIVLTFGMWSSLILLTYVKVTLNKTLESSRNNENIKTYQLSRITELGGLANSNPGIAFSIFLMLISMGGIPPLAGFNAKVSIFYALIEKAFTDSFGGFLPFVLIVAMLSSILSVFYYIRIIKILTFISKTQQIKNPIIFKFDTTLSGVSGAYILAFITSFNIFSFLLFLS